MSSVLKSMENHPSDVSEIRIKTGDNGTQELTVCFSDGSEIDAIFDSSDTVRDWLMQRGSWENTPVTWDYNETVPLYNL